MKSSRLLRHLGGENIGRFPVWMMRQAGRYLPSYRKLREKNTFWQMVTNPEIAAKVTLLPFEELSLDAAILFSDILTLPRASGIEIDLVESIGPVVNAPLKRSSDFKMFLDFDPSRQTPYVAEAVLRVRETLDAEIEVIGFAGAPWTVASYLVEGKSSRHFAKLLGWAFEDPESLVQALEALASATSRYLKLQIQSGARVVQLFDTWLGSAPPEFLKLYYPIIRKLIREVQESEAKVVYFAKNVAHELTHISELNADVLGIDSSISILRAGSFVGSRASLQGNLDPVVLLGSESSVRRLTRELVSNLRELGRPPIVNLGHGILPETPLKNAKAFVAEACTLWI